ncbi:MAG: hypothetical protein IKC56_00625 [Clostridia bacterium]|nr:hypothetical protein [Clostridia bacterium]
MPNKAKSLITKIKNLKNKEYILAVLLGVIVLVIFLGQMGAQNTKKTKESASFSPTEYVSSLELKLEKVLSKMEGAGKSTVVLTVASGMQNVPYLKEDGTALQSGGKVVMLKESYPEIVGVVIVCEGANSYLTKLQVTGAACALLNISEDRVRVYPKAS